MAFHSKQTCQVSASCNIEQLWKKITEVHKQIPAIITNDNHHHHPPKKNTHKMVKIHCCTKHSENTSIKEQIGLSFSESRASNVGKVTHFHMHVLRKSRAAFVV